MKTSASSLKIILLLVRKIIALVLLLLFSATGVQAETTNTLSDGEIQGRLFAQKILVDLMRTENFSNSVTLQVRPKKGTWTNYVVTSRGVVGRGYWKNIFTSDALKPASEVFTVTHTLGQPNIYTHEAVSGTSGKMLPSSRSTPFANSDFWLGDLALDFFHWPEQRILKREFHSNCACTVLESVNSAPTKNDYTRVVSWIDNDSLGLVEAYGYDAEGKLLKEFTPKSIKKVSGQWQVKEIEIRNVQTGSRTRLEFDLK